MQIEKIKQIIKAHKNEGMLRVWVKPDESVNVWVDKIDYWGVVDIINDNIEDGRPEEFLLSVIKPLFYNEEDKRYELCCAEDQSVCIVNLDKHSDSEVTLKAVFKDEIDNTMKKIKRIYK